MHVPFSVHVERTNMRLLREECPRREVCRRVGDPSGGGRGAGSSMDGRERERGRGSRGGRMSNGVDADEMAGVEGELGRGVVASVVEWVRRRLDSRESESGGLMEVEGTLLWVVIRLNWMGEDGVYG